MHQGRDLELRPLFIALAGTLVILLLALGTRAQAAHPPLQTVPTPTPPTVPTPTRGIADSPPPDENPSLGGNLALLKVISRPDVLPGEELEFTLWATNTSETAVTGIILTDSLDRFLHPLVISATQGAAEVRDHSLYIHIGTLEPGQSALAVVLTRIDPDTPKGHIILNQVTAFFDGGQVSSNVVAAGLPPIELPATGQSGRGP